MVRFIGIILKYKVILAILLLAAVMLAGAGNSSAANLKDAFVSGGPLDTAAGQDGAGYNTDLALEGMVGLIIQTAWSILGIIFLILIIYGGYIWLNARGVEQNVEKAKDIIKTAIIGLIIVIGAYAISWFIINGLAKKTLLAS